MKNLFRTIILASILGAGALTVLAAESAPLNLAQVETITSQELGVDNPGILPGNPFYFLKEWGRGVRRVFTFDPIAKVGYELRITNQKAAEAKKVEEVKPQDTEAITTALQNYQESEERLKTRLEALKETSQNPEIDKLLDQVADRSIQHQKVFEDIAEKFKDNEDIHQLVNETQGKIDDATIAAAGKSDPAEFASKLEKALISSNGNELKHIRSVETLDRLEQKAPEDLRNAFNRLREDFSVRLEQDIQELLKTENSTSIESAVQALPGDGARRAVLLDEIRNKAEFRVAEVLGRASDILEKSALEEKDISEKAQEQIQHAIQVIGEAEKTFANSSAPSSAAKNLLSEAQGNLKEARVAFDSKKYGEAFGQARSAEVLARNALRLLSETQSHPEDLKMILDELTAKVEKYSQLLREKGYSEEKNPKAFAILSDARKHLGFANEAFEKNDAANVKLHIGHVRGYLQDLSRLIETEMRPEKPLPIASPPAYREPIACPAVHIPACEKDAVSEECVRQVKELIVKYPKCGFESLLRKNTEEPVVCTKEYKPVCGVNGTTYGNGCEARVAKVTITREGTCESAVKPQEPTEPPQLCTLEYSPVCGADGKTYSNRCFAKAARVEVKQEGTCETVAPRTSVQAEPAITAAIDPLLQVFVTITENGQFDPVEIKERKGGKVTWVNKSKLFVWPASGDHPTHLLYPGFDALRGIGNGDTYSFVFEKIGAWTYHDHLNPGVGGKIIIVE